MATSRDSRRRTLLLCLYALFLAITVILSSSVFCIPLPNGSHLYLTDAAICVAALLFHPLAALAVGGLGAFLGDLFFYPTAMLVSLVVHGAQAFVVSFLFRHVLKNHPGMSSGIAVGAGALIMAVGYGLGVAFVYGTPESALLKFPLELLQSVTGGAVALLLYWKCGIRTLFSRLLRRN